jgi:membrane protease YdiL (CAAX protease family)
MGETLAKDHKTKLAAGIFIAIILVPITGRLALGGKGYDTQYILWSRCFFWLEIVVLACYSKWVEKGRFFLWSPQKQKFWFYPASFGALYLLTIAAGLAGNIPKLFGIPDNREVMEQMVHVLNQSMPLMIFGAVTAGVTEELIFRAYIVPRLALVFKNKYMPVIVSALAFSALHYRYLSVHELLFTFLFGIVFAIHYQWYRNISILIITHAIIDFVSFLLLGFVEAYKISHHIIQH